MSNQQHTGPIRIVVIDDHPVVRLGLKALFASNSDMSLIGEAGDAAQGFRLVRELQPNVVLLDLKLPGQAGLDALDAAQQTDSWPPVRVVLLTASDDKTEYVRAMKLGCSGIILKASPTDLIEKCIRKVHAGEIWLDTTTTAAVMREFARGDSPLPPIGAGPNAASDRPLLSTREREIVMLVAQGYKNREMAEKLYISEQTVKNHLHNIFDKLGVSDRLELALYAIHRGLHLTHQ